MPSNRLFARLVAPCAFAIIAGISPAQDATPAATPTPEATPTPAAEAAPTGAKIPLKFGAQAGAQFIIRRSTVQELDHMLNNAPVHTHAELAMEIQFAVHSVEPSTGVATVMATYKRFRHLEKGPTSNLDFDSDAGEPGSRMGPMPALIYTLKDRAFWLQVDSTGKVVAMKGATELAQTAFATADVPGGAQGAQLIQNLVGQYNDDSMTRTISGMLSNLPPGPVAVGESWERTAPEMQMGIASNGASKFTLVSSDAEKSVISSTVTITPAVPAPEGPEVAGTRTATYEINSTYGVLSKGTVTVDLMGRANLAAGLSQVKNHLDITLELLPAR